MLLKCECCGNEKTFVDGDDAFQHGWDAPPHFTGYVTCNLCPAVCIVLSQGHTKAHAHWAKHGRPDDFGTLCLTDKDWGKSQEDFEAEMAGVKQMVGELIGKIPK